ncbi:MAG: hypothetical protein ACI8TL_001488 [Natronomonas sp.]|jgi:hypothetical protein
MFRPPTDPRYRPDPARLTWGGIAVSYGILVGTFALLWMRAHPVIGTLMVACGATLLVIARRLGRLRRCLRECDALTVTIGDRARITITQPYTDSP